MVDFVEELLKKYGFQLDIKTNLYQHEIHVDQNGTLSNEVVFDILCSNDPYMTLSEILDNLYIGYIQHLKSQMQKEVDIALGALSSTNLTALEKRMYFNIIFSKSLKQTSLLTQVKMISYGYWNSKVIQENIFYLLKIICFLIPS